MMHVMRGDGDGTTVYFGQRQGSPFVGVGLRGFHGWQSHPRWLRGGWAFFSPHVHIGRLYQDCGRWWSCRIILPARLVDWWRR